MVGIFNIIDLLINLTEHINQLHALPPPRVLLPAAAKIPVFLIVCA
jgi:hypothetical protein